jgi:hypothetical protein
LRRKCDAPEQTGVPGDLGGIVEVLADAGVEVILIGGLAAQAHGSARLTQHADFVYGRSDANIARLADALAPFSAYLRGAPPGLPFRFDPPTIRRGLNFTLTTTVGDTHFLGEIVGGGTARPVGSRAVGAPGVFRGLRCARAPAGCTKKCTGYG